MVIDTVERIEQDFKQQNEPFDDVEFPESRLVREIKVQASDTDEPIALSMEERARLATYFSTLDYNRNANQLVDKLLELHERKPEWFDPYGVPMGKGSMEEVFTDIGFRYGSRDANGWWKNSQILRDKYHGNVTELMLDTGCDAVTLVERLNEDDFMYLKGDKIAPMYARILSDEVTELDNLWQLEIPVDTHIRRLSKELFAAHAIAPETKFNDDDFIRSVWREVADDADISRHVVDSALWQIGNNWENWGKEYWEEVTE